MHPRSRIRGREPPPPHHASIGCDRRSRADVLLEAGRLAAHYLVAQGVLPEHLLHAREQDPNHVTSIPEPPPAGYVSRKQRDDAYPDDDPRWRRNERAGAGAGDWARDSYNKGDDDRPSRARSGWDRRSQSFDERRRHKDGGDVDRGGRRGRAYDEPRRPPMSRSYSHNDRRASGDDRRPAVDGRLDRRRRSRSRSRSRSRTRTRSYHSGGRRESDWRAGSGDLDHKKVPQSRTVTGGDGNVGGDDVDKFPRDAKAPRSEVVVEADGGGSHEDEGMESEDRGQSEGHGQDDGTIHEDEEMESEYEEQEVCEDEEEDENDAVAGLNDAEAGEINATEQQLSNADVELSHVDVAQPSEPVEEPTHMESQLSDVEGDMNGGVACRETCQIEPVANNSDCSEVRVEMEALPCEVEPDVADLTRDEQELPAWYGIFDLNVAGTHESCEMSDIPSNPPADHACDSLPDLVGLVSQQVCYDTSETQGQYEGECADDNQQSEDTQMLVNQGIGTYDLNDRILPNQRSDEHEQDNHQLVDEQMLLNNEETLLKQDADELEGHNHLIENEQMLQNQDPAVQVLENYHVNGEQLLHIHATDEHPEDNHRIKNEQMLLHHVSGVHELDNCDLNGEQMLLHNDADKPAADGGQLEGSQMLLDQAADRQATLHNLGNGRIIPVINLEDDEEEQSDTREFLEPKSGVLRTDNALHGHMYSQDKQSSSSPDHPQTNIPAASSPVAQKFGNRWTGRGAINAQGIPSDDDVLYGAFDKIPLEVINVWDLPSTELGKSL